MKKIINKFIWIFTTFILLLNFSSTFIMAVDLEEDLDYVINADGKTARITGLNNKTLSKLVIPSEIEHDGEKYVVTSIYTQAFKYCVSLQEIIIPNSVTNIREEAFYRLYKIKRDNNTK